MGSALNSGKIAAVGISATKREIDEVSDMVKGETS
jgi:hypothetical protein